MVQALLAAFGMKVEGLGFRVKCSWFRVQVSGLGFRVNS